MVRLLLEMVPMECTILVWADTAASNNIATCLYRARKMTMDTIHGLERSMYVMSTLPEGRCTSYQKMLEIDGGRGGAAGS